MAVYLPPRRLREVETEKPKRSLRVGDQHRLSNFKLESAEPSSVDLQRHSVSPGI